MEELYRQADQDWSPPRYCHWADGREYRACFDYYDAIPDNPQMRLYQLKNRILPEFYLRRDKRLISHEACLCDGAQLTLQLPVKRDVAIFCPLAPDQIIAYKAILESEGDLA